MITYDVIEVNEELKIVKFDVSDDKIKVRIWLDISYKDNPPVDYFEKFLLSERQLGRLSND